MSFLEDAFKVINFIDSAGVIYNRSSNFDPRFALPEYWKNDKFNNVINTWVTFYVGDTEDDDNFEEVTIFGVSISLNKSPKIIETQVKGFNSPVFQQFSNDSFDITINYTETGPVFWQQNSRQLTKLVNMLDKPQTLNIASPQLNLTYGINKVVVKGYSIGQDDRFYTHNPISISLKSDISTDILIPTQQI